MKRISKKLSIFRSVLSSIYFNLKYLPFKQAVKLPILLYKPKLVETKGNIVINGPIRTGMIRLGFQSVSIYPNTGIIFENHGGTLIFEGDCFIGSGSAVSIGDHGVLHIGKRLMANTAVKIIAYHDIKLGDDCRLAWETMMLDTDLHAMTKPDGTLSKGYGSIEIGEGCWLGTRCMVLKNTKLPAHTTVQARTVLSKHYDIPEKCVIGTDANVVIKAKDTYRDLSNDKIVY